MDKLFVAMLKQLTKCHVIKFLYITFKLNEAIYDKVYFTPVQLVLRVFKRK